MSTQNNQPPLRRGTSTANPPASTPGHYPPPDYSFTLQAIMELKGAVGQLSEAMARLNRQFERIEEKSEKRFDSLESSMAGVRLTISIAAAVLAIIVGVSGFFIDKAWDAVSNRVEITVKK